MPEFQTTHDLSLAARQVRGRIWVDGCFDFAHHGHAGAVLQARRLGTELYVGVHSDEEILKNKGPTVMELGERIAAVSACRWTTAPIPDAPYVTELAFIDQYSCKYVVHGDDITSDAGGEDCYRFVKSAGRFLVVKRTPGISTTDLVGRMLLETRGHHIRSLAEVLAGREGHGGDEEKAVAAREMKTRMEEYATDETGLHPKVQVWIRKSGKAGEDGGTHPWESLVPGLPPKPGQRLVYVDGGFDLFCSGHIEFLEQVARAEEEAAEKAGWFEPAAAKRRVEESGADYSPAYIVAGVHDDAAVNRAKGANYPIMNVFERGLCVLQCKYVSAVLFDAPYAASRDVLTSLPFDKAVDAVYHGPAPTSDEATYPNSSGKAVEDPYAAAKEMGFFVQLGSHAYQDVNAAQIVRRIMARRTEYEERQRKKGVKAAGEEEARKREVESQGS